MKRFNFSFDKLTEKKRSELEELQRESSPIVKKINQLSEYGRKLQDNLKKSHSTKSIDPFFMLNYEIKQRHFQQKSISAIEKTKLELLPWQKKIQKKNTEIKALEILKEKRLKEWRSKRDKAEQNQMEESFLRYQF